MSIDDTYTEDQMRRAPKVLLHDHLDGGLRPATVIDLARETEDHLPTTDADELAAWFTAGAARGDLVLYLEGFAHRRRHADARRPRAGGGGCVEDLADDGVVYAEVRFALEQHLEGGLSLDQVVEAVLAGIRQGQDGRPITVGLLLSAMRTAANSADIADLVLRHRDAGVVGFDIAGSESGSPPSRHLDAPGRIAEANHHITIHAGEAFGLPSIWEALQLCGAERLGHGGASSTTSRSVPTASRARPARQLRPGSTGAARCARRRTSTRARRPASPST